MLKLLLGLVLLGALAAGIALYPLRGRTVLDRWRAAPTASAFVTRGWNEARQALAGHPERTRSGRAPAAPHAPARPAKPPLPTEQHTASDRAALDRIVSEAAGR